MKTDWTCYNPTTGQKIELPSTVLGSMQGICGFKILGFTHIPQSLSMNISNCCI